MATGALRFGGKDATEVDYEDLSLRDIYAKKRRKSLRVEKLAA